MHQIIITKQKKRRCSSTVSSSNKISCCGQIPRLERTEFISDPMSKSWMEAVPDEGGYKPVIIALVVNQFWWQELTLKEHGPVSIEMVVDLPAPLCPNKAVIWSSYMFKCKFFTAVFFPNIFDNPWILIPAYAFGSGSSKCFGVELAPETGALCWSGAPFVQYHFWGIQQKLIFIGRTHQFRYTHIRWFIALYPKWIIPRKRNPKFTRKDSFNIQGCYEIQNRIH